MPRCYLDAGHDGALYCTNCKKYFCAACDREVHVPHLEQHRRMTMPPSTTAPAARESDSLPPLPPMIEPIVKRVARRDPLAELTERFPAFDLADLREMLHTCGSVEAVAAFLAPSGQEPTPAPQPQPPAAPPAHLSRFGSQAAPPSLVQFLASNGRGAPDAHVIRDDDNSDDDLAVVGEVRNAASDVVHVETRRAPHGRHQPQQQQPQQPQQQQQPQSLAQLAEAGHRSVRDLHRIRATQLRERQLRQEAARQARSAGAPPPAHGVSGPLVDDLSTVFPSLARSVIASVLQSVGGQVDRAVQQLLHLANNQQSAESEAYETALEERFLMHPDDAPPEPLRPEAKARIDKEFEECRSSARSGFRVTRGDVDHSWTVRLFNFDSDSLLGRELLEFHKKFGSGEPEIVCEVMFPANYPVEPPQIRVILPRFVPLSSPVLTGGRIAFDPVAPENWTPETRMHTLLTQLRFLFIADGGRVNLKNGKPYPKHSRIASSARPAMRPLRNRGELSYRLRCQTGSSSDPTSTGNYILLPSSVLGDIERRDLWQPLLQFRLSSGHSDASTHCSVREFTAPPGTVVVPQWVMENLGLEENTNVEVTLTELPPATRASIQPQSVDFLEIVDPKRALEVALSKLCALTKGDVIRYQHSNKVYFAEVVNLEPADACHIVNVDLEVDFLPPLDFNEEEYARRMAERKQEEQRKQAEAHRQADDSRRLGSTRTESNGQPPPGHVKCKNCLNFVESDTYDVHLRRCLENIKYCPRCRIAMPVSQWDAHYNEAHTMEECICGQNFERFELERHRTTDCPFRMARCPYCKVLSTYDEVEQHKGYCGSQTSQCEVCQRRVLRRELDDHMTEAHGQPIGDDKPELETRSAAELMQHRPDAVARATAARRAAPSATVQVADSADAPAASSGTAAALLREPAPARTFRCPKCREAFPSLDEVFLHSRQCTASRSSASSSQQQQQQPVRRAPAASISVDSDDDDDDAAGSGAPMQRQHSGLSTSSGSAAFSFKTSLRTPREFTAQLDRELRRARPHHDVVAVDDDGDDFAGAVARQASTTSNRSQQSASSDSRQPRSTALEPPSQQQQQQQQSQRSLSPAPVEPMQLSYTLRGDPEVSNSILQVTLSSNGVMCDTEGNTVTATVITTSEPMLVAFVFVDQRMTATLLTGSPSDFVHFMSGLVRDMSDVIVPT